MRPLTEALLRANAERLTQRGWKPDEQRCCFRKADALLDYIGKIKSSEYKVHGLLCKRLNDQRVEGLRYCLEKAMPSKKMRGQSLEVLSQLLSIGEEILKRAAWLFKNYPALFKARYASSPQAFAKDIHAHFVLGHAVPQWSFSAFKTGENPVISRNNLFLNKCIEMYNDDIFESSEYQKLSQQNKKKDPYHLWYWKHQTGKKFVDENLALQHIIKKLASENQISLNQDKAITSQLLQKQQKTK